VGDGTLTITNVTLSGNTAGYTGGAIDNFKRAALKAIKSTIVDNVDLGGPGTSAGHLRPDTLIGI
jgi:hypothetical protein